MKWDEIDKAFREEANLLCKHSDPTIAASGKRLKEVLGHFRLQRKNSAKTNGSFRKLIASLRTRVRQLENQLEDKTYKEEF